MTAPSEQEDLTMVPVAASALRSGHNHPLPPGPVVIVHAGPLDPEDGLVATPMHAFGPFASENAARAWDATTIDDDCTRLILDLFGVSADPLDGEGI